MEMAQSVSMKPADKQMLDLGSAPRMKEPRDPSRHLMTREQVAQAQVSGSQLPPNPSALPPQFPQYPPTQPLSAGSVSPTAEGGTIPVPAQAPVFPTDHPRVSDRINRIFGQRRAAEERATAAEAELATMRERVERLEGRYMSPIPSAPPGQFAQPPSQYQYPFEAAQQNAPPPGGEFVSRQELSHLLERQTRLIGEQLRQQNALSNAHSVSRLEAERDFPELFRDPELRGAMDQVLTANPALRSDERGPYLAALMVRGLLPSAGGTAPSQGGLVSPTARKEALSAIGASVPEGSGAPDDRVARYEQALARAAMTGKEEDAAYARLIALGQA